MIVFLLSYPNFKAVPLFYNIFALTFGVQQIAVNFFVCVIHKFASKNQQLLEESVVSEKAAKRISLQQQEEKKSNLL
jgi:hypothetical protein